MELLCELGGGKEHIVITDTGASRTIFPASAVPTNAILQPSHTRLLAAINSTLRNLGTISFYASSNDSPKLLIQAIISADLEGLRLVGWRDLMALNILPSNFPFPIAMRTARVYEDEDENVLSTFGENHGNDESNNFWEPKDHKSCFGIANVVGQVCRVTQSNPKLDAINAWFPDVMCLSLEPLKVPR